MTYQPAEAYQFRITLQDVKPVVWRRIQTPSRYSFWDLHNAVQDAMGWKDAHLHEFVILDPRTRENVTIGIPDDGGIGDEREIIPGWERSISEFFSAEIPTARYVYDFGDDWVHEIAFEESCPLVEGGRYPTCLDGKGACPPEDCGGSFGYAEFLRAIKKPGSPRGGELLEWVGGSFDPKKFHAGDVVFEDPSARLSWVLDESVILAAEIALAEKSPRKPDRQGRLAFRLPLAQHELILKQVAPAHTQIKEQFEDAVIKEKLATVKLAFDELQPLIGLLASAMKKKPRKLDGLILSSLHDHFRTMNAMFNGD